MTNRLGEFLRARRGLVRPADAGLPDLAERRVPGLRRDELAALAGVSPEYYARLEQGRDRNPSEQVLTSLARALRLDADTEAHLRRLVHPPRAGAPGPERLAPGLQELIDAWPDTPALVWGRHLDVLAANALAVALAPRYAPGTNLFRSFFLDPASRALHPDWEAMAGNVTAILRRLAGAAPDDRRLTGLVSELTAGSTAFARHWSRHDARRTTTAVKRFTHPTAGELELAKHAFTVPGADEQTLVVYRAEPDSPAAARLRRLAASAA
ncbi:helix-turn-helix domain-containing protein [Amycolatopsis sp. NPDC051106]|uniref:helix-turn-helix domain-containing protein n=1 Tax=unclassified Amycolatopsis TaxID=2618356 RepID=UPI0034446841